jgi:mono/diheme cytochrome c family protein
MRRLTFVLVVLAAALGLAAAGCGGEEEATPTPETVTGTLPTETTPTETTATETVPAPEGDPVAGKAVFTGVTANCAGCHTLADAGSAGTVGPNLDEAMPSYELVVDRVTNGRAQMPSFSGTLTEEQIADVAAYVSQSAGG